MAMLKNMHLLVKLLVSQTKAIVVEYLAQFMFLHLTIVVVINKIKRLHEVLQIALYLHFNSKQNC